MHRQMFENDNKFNTWSHQLKTEHNLKFTTDLMIVNMGLEFTKGNYFAQSYTWPDRVVFLKRLYLFKLYFDALTAVF